MKKIYTLLFIILFSIPGILAAQNAAGIQTDPGSNSYSSTITISAYPNPTSEKINISFLVKKDNLVTIRLIDLLGNEITMLYNERFSKGEFKQALDIPSRIPKGLYFVKVTIGGEVAMRRISIQ